MKHTQTRDAHRLHIPRRRDLRDIAVAASAVVAAGVFTVAAGDRILADAGPIPAAAPAATADDQCDLVTRGSWISFDGTTWEHVDGRIVTVANPRSAATGCDRGTSDESGRP